MAARLKLSVSTQDDSIVVAVAGALSLEGGDSLEFMKLVERQLQAGYRKIVVDLSNCDYCDSSGIAALVSAFTKSANVGGKIAIANPQQRLRELFAITNLETILQPYNTLESALAALRSDAP
jgi:anti-sigma B factor antagonist